MRYTLESANLVRRIEMLTDRCVSLTNHIFIESFDAFSMLFHSYLNLSSLTVFPHSFIHPSAEWKSVTAFVFLFIFLHALTVNNAINPYTAIVFFHKHLKNYCAVCAITELVYLTILYCLLRKFWEAIS